MKIGHLLLEATSPKLLKIVKGPDYDNVGPYYVFLWQQQYIKQLVAAGAKTGGGVTGARPESEYGLGIVDVRTGDICVGGIVNEDGELKAYWTSTTDDPKIFFDRVQQDGIKKIRNFPSRLQYLADRFQILQDNNEDDDKKEITSSGVQKIIDTLQSEEYDRIPSSFYEFDTDSVIAAKDFIEENLSKLKHQIYLTKKRTSKIETILNDESLTSKMSEEEIDKLVDQYNSLGGGINLGLMEKLKTTVEKFLRVERDLFDPSLNSDEDEIDSDNTDNEEQVKDAQQDIDDWESDFKADFPKLDMEAMALYPVY